MHVQSAVLLESACKEQKVSHLQITKIFFSHPINDANFKANPSDIPRTTPLACFPAAATGCAAEDEEAAYWKHELSPFDTSAAQWLCFFPSSFTYQNDHLRNQQVK